MYDVGKITFIHHKETHRVRVRIYALGNTGSDEHVCVPARRTYMFLHLQFSINKYETRFKRKLKSIKRDGTVDSMSNLSITLLN